MMGWIRSSRIKKAKIRITNMTRWIRLSKEASARLKMDFLLVNNITICRVRPHAVQLTSLSEKNQVEIKVFPYCEFETFLDP